MLNAVAERIGWGKPAPQGVYRGLAQMKAFDSYVAAAAEVSVTGGNKIKVHRIVGATDPGYAVNPAQIDRQVAGSFVYGLSALFYQECTVKDGRIEQTNFDTYNSMRIAEMPKVESIVMPSGGSEPWGGVGEPTICVAAPAVLNAFFKATGQAHPLVPAEEPQHPDVPDANSLESGGGPSGRRFSFAGPDRAAPRAGAKVAGFAPCGATFCPDCRLEPTPEVIATPAWRRGRFGRGGG